ncbi:hypothetical protein RJ639_027439 [Escallonia herrerae]|uniref:Transposase-associated domain-containing protein n=1 Tax=Escallonia herrerae TaxID=1293975 RepID=A0AA89BD51_9ASTE|nr:hypothetical protein RJ639_027439 [Escallonia herrerae]
MVGIRFLSISARACVAKKARAGKQELHEADPLNSSMFCVANAWTWRLVQRLKVNMDKSWINIRNRLDPLYEKGANDFVQFASKDRPNATEILCPCTKCRNMRFVKKVDVAKHIVVDGFLNSYTHWIFHGESSLTSSSIPEPIVSDRTQEMIRDAFGVPMFNQLDQIGSGEGNEDSDGLDDGTKKFFNLARESNRATQHSGVLVKANTDSYASARDMNPIAGDVNYYGVLTDIIVLHYSKKFRFVLFKCDWVDNGIGLVDRDGLGFTLVQAVFASSHLSIKIQALQNLYLEGFGLVNILTGHKTSQNRIKES